MTIWRLVAFVFLFLAAACGDDCKGVYRSGPNGLLVFVGCGDLIVPVTPTHVGQ